MNKRAALVAVVASAVGSTICYAFWVVGDTLPNQWAYSVKGAGITAGLVVAFLIGVLAPTGKKYLE
jgi:hypothetical protein